MKGFSLAAGLLLSLISVTAGAQTTAETPLDAEPGYLPNEYLEMLQPDAVSVEINLQGAMLRMIGALAGAEDEEFAALVGALRSIRVRSGEIPAGDSEAVRRRLTAGRRWLEDHGWLALVRVNEDGEEVFIYSREREGELLGLTVLALEDTEVTAVNLVGRIDPAQIARLVEGLDLGVLDDVDLRLDRAAEEER